MGQRGAQAAFMPNKFVFPGGADDPQDAAVPLLSEISSPCKDRLSEESEGPSAQALCAAAIRELFEETGQILDCIARGDCVSDKYFFRAQ